MEPFASLSPSSAWRTSPAGSWRNDDEWLTRHYLCTRGYSHESVGTITSLMITDKNTSLDALHDLEYSEWLLAIVAGVRDRCGWREHKYTHNSGEKNSEASPLLHNPPSAIVGWEATSTEWPFFKRSGQTWDWCPLTGGPYSPSLQATTLSLSKLLKPCYNIN